MSLKPHNMSVNVDGMAVKTVVWNS